MNIVNVLRERCQLSMKVIFTLFEGEEESRFVAEGKATYAVDMQDVVMLRRVDCSNQAFDLPKISTATDSEEEHDGGRLIG